MSPPHRFAEPVFIRSLCKGPSHHFAPTRSRLQEMAQNLFCLQQMAQDRLQVEGVGED
jgi:hypothetical protein